MASAPTAHVPPQNIEAEESVLGAMLVAESSLTRVIDEVKLGASDFYLEKHAAIFTCVHDLYAASKPVDELSVTEALVQRNQIEQAGGKHYVSELAEKLLFDAAHKEQASDQSGAAALLRPTSLRLWVAQRIDILRAIRESGPATVGAWQRSPIGVRAAAPSTGLPTRRRCGLSWSNRRSLRVCVVAQASC